jgi:hypothetical protein
MGAIVSRPLKTTPDGRTYFIDYDGSKVFIGKPAPPSPPPPSRCTAPIDVRLISHEKLDTERVAALVEDCVRNNRATVNIRDLVAHCAC